MHLQNVCGFTGHGRWVLICVFKVSDHDWHKWAQPSQQGSFVVVILLLIKNLRTIIAKNGLVLYKKL